MSNGQLVRKDSGTELLLSILALILGILALLVACFSWKSIIYMIISLLISIPSIVFSVLNISKSRTRIGFPVAGLFLNKAAWVVISCALVWRLYAYIINCFI